MNLKSDMCRRQSYLRCKIRQRRVVAIRTLSRKVSIVSVRSISSNVPFPHEKDSLVGEQAQTRQAGETEESKREEEESKAVLEAGDIAPKA